MSRQATSRLKVNPMLGLRPTLMNCRLEDLSIDPSYQRSIENSQSLTLIRKIAMFWDWTLFHPLAVASRDGGGLFVVDGQHRLAAARMRGDLLDLPCVVSAYASPADEAASFVAMNVQRRKLDALDLFRAAMAADDNEATAIVAAMHYAGLSLAPHTNFSAWKPGMLSNVTGLQKLWRRYGPEVSGKAMQVLAQAFPGEVLRYGGTIYPGIVIVVSEIPTISVTAFAALLRAHGQAALKTWIGERRAAIGCRWDQAAGIELRTMWADETEDAA